MAQVVAWDTPVRKGADQAKTFRRSSAVNGRTTFDAAVEIWLADYVSPKTGRSYAPTTQNTIRYVLLGNRMAGFRQAHGVVNIQDWNADLAAQYVTWYQKEMGADADTARGARNYLRQFAKFCAERWNHETAVGPALTDLRINSAADGDAGQEDALTKGEAQVLLKATRTTRDKLIVAMLLYTGMRPSELTALEERHVFLTRNPPVVIVEGSAHNPYRPKSSAGFRTIPLTIGQTLLPKLLNDLISDPERPPGAQRLLLSKKRDAKAGNAPLTLFGLGVFLQRLSEATGIHANAYRFRHTFCTWNADAGMQQLHLQTLLGHASPEMTARYYRGKASPDLLRAVTQIRY